uniref:XRRM domain-containing protein n=2 Tax=Lygus hesperus TaxID=30085 RepID=A0A0A9YZJ0_LYGHE
MEMGIETPLTPPTSPPIEQHNELYSPASPLPQDEELFSPTSPPPQYEELYPSPPSPADVLPRRMYGGLRELAKKVAEEGEKLKIGEEELSLRVLEGEEEEKYHQKVKEQMLKRRNQNPKHRKGGRRGGRKMGRGGRKRGGSPASRNDSKKARRD